VADGIVASIPLGVLALAAIALAGLGLVLGWLTARAQLRRRSARAARHDARRITDALDALPQPAIVVDAYARVTARNAPAAQLLQALAPDNDLPLSVDAAIGRVIRSRVAETFETPWPGQPQRRWRVQVSPLHAGDSTAEALLLLADSNAGADRADVYRQLTGLLAHELRTPLTAIMGHVDILGSCRIDEEDLWRRSLGFVAGEVDRLARLVEDLLSLSRLDRIPLHLQPMNVRAAAEEALSTLFDSAEQRDVNLVLQAPNDLPRAQADPDRIRQVFLNLIDNAIKHAPGSTVTVKLAPEDRAVRVEVSDDGPGIPADDLPHIFEPLYRGGQAAPDTRGSGLGLTIVRTILDQHHAPISVNSASGLGATFTFSLPVRVQG